MEALLQCDDLESMVTCDVDGALVQRQCTDGSSDLVDLSDS